MNIFMQKHGEIFRMTQALRTQMMAQLTDADLAYTLPGDNVSLGELCRQMGEVQHSYIQSLKDRKQDWSYQHPDPDIANSVDRLQAWFAELDQALLVLMESLSDEDLHQTIERGDGFQPSVAMQLHVYREAMLIFDGKASIYLKALQRPVSPQWDAWIG